MKQKCVTVELMLHTILYGLLYHAYKLLPVIKLNWEVVTLLNLLLIEPISMGYGDFDFTLTHHNMSA